MGTLGFKGFGIVGAGVDTTAFATFESGGCHDAADKHHVLEFPASRFIEDSTADIICPEVQLLTCGEQLGFAAGNADLPPHEAAEGVSNVGEVQGFVFRPLFTVCGGCQARCCEIVGMLLAAADAF